MPRKNREPYQQKQPFKPKFVPREPEPTDKSSNNNNSNNQKDEYKYTKDYRNKQQKYVEKDKDYDRGEKQEKK